MIREKTSFALEGFGQLPAEAELTRDDLGPSGSLDIQVAVRESNCPPSKAQTCSEASSEEELDEHEFAGHSPYRAQCRARGAGAGTCDQ